MTSELEVNDNTLHGTLLGYDSTTYRFRFAPSDGGTIIHGKVAENAVIPLMVMIPERYKATIKTFTRVKYSTEQTEVTHELRSLSSN